MKNLSLKVKLLVISIVLAVVPSVVVGGFAFMSAYDGVKGVTKQDLTYIIRLETKLLAKSIETAKSESELKKQVEETLLDFKQNYYEKNNQVGYGYVLDSKGIILFHPDPKYIGADFSKYDFIQKMTANKTGYLEYEWEGKQKVAAYGELPNGWIFSASAYLTDMMTPIAPIQQDVIVTCLVAAIVASLIAFFIVRYLTKPMQEVIRAMEAVGEGDLTNDVPIRTNDEIGRISAMYNEMLHKLRAILMNINEASQQVASSSEQLSASADENARASEQIATAAEEISSGSQEQVERVNEVVNTIHRISESIESTANNVKKIDEDSKGARDYAEDGMKRLALVVEEMADITNKVRNTERVIRELGQQSESIMGIITAIRDISEQTNLLALNAAIEAARAGEQGKSFAVVAGEVRKLAEQSGRSADDIANLIVTINSEIHQATEMMKASTEAVADGERVVQTASDSFKDIMAAVVDVNEEMDELAQSMKVVQEATKGIIRNVESISEVAASAAGDTEEVAAASEEQTAAMEEITAASQMLAKMAERLQGEVGQFKL